VKQSDVGEYEENAREKQNIQYTGKSTNFPSNQAIQMANTNPPPRKSAKREASRGLVNISANCLGVYVSHLNVSLLYMISQEVVSSLNMSYLFVKDWILATEMALVLPHMRGTL
jgi:hypothetical protein